VKVAGAALLLAAARLAAAEPFYVIEHLVVGVNSAPDGAGERIGTLRSGDEVEMLERLAADTRVRLPNGAEGWVKSAYLSREEPLRKQLAERSRELEALRARLARAEEELATARSGLSAPGEPSAPEVAELASPERTLFPARAATEQRPSWALVCAAGILALAGGFGLGWRVLDRRIRRKYGGLRIY
jgi:hypothetical protein